MKRGLNLFILVYWSLAAYAGLRLTSGAPPWQKVLAPVVAIVLFLALLLAWRLRAGALAPRTPRGQGWPR